MEIFKPSIYCPSRQPRRLSHSAHYRRLGEMGPAMGGYQQALIFNPRHRSAREHLGELDLALGEPIKAEEQIAALKEICLIPCDELADLERAIAAYKVAAQRP